MTTILPLITNYGIMMRTPGMLTTMNTDDETWNNYTAAVVSPYIDKKRFSGLADMVADPFHPSRYWFSTLEDGIIGIDHGKYYRTYNHTTSDHKIQWCEPNVARVTGMAFAADSNLWCFNEGVDRARTARGTTSNSRALRRVTDSPIFAPPGAADIIRYGVTSTSNTRPPTSSSLTMAPTSPPLPTTVSPISRRSLPPQASPSRPTMGEASMKAPMEPSGCSTRQASILSIIRQPSSGILASYAPSSRMSFPTVSPSTTRVACG